MIGVDDVSDHPVERSVRSSTPRFSGRVLSIRTDVVDLGDGTEVERDIVEHPGAVGVIAVDDDLQVLLIQQYRHPVGALLWEPPAGLLDVDGEDPLHAASRELFEEAGYRARDWAVLLDAFTSPGGSDESVRLYLARSLSEVDPSERHVGEDEERDMPIRWMSLEAARDAVLAGRLHSPLGAMGILAAAAVLLDGASAGLRPTQAPWLRARRHEHRPA